MKTEEINKKITVFYCSPKVRSHSQIMLDCLLKKLPNNYEITTINVYENQVKPCVDCGFCKTHIGCIYNDMDNIDKLLNESDVLIIASPIYNLSFPSPFKAILDRFQRYFSARFAQNIKPPIKKHKDAYLLLNCGSKGDKNYDFAIAQLKMIFTVLNTTLIDSYVWENTDNENSKCDFETIEKIARKI